MGKKGRTIIVEKGKGKREERDRYSYTNQLDEAFPRTNDQPREREKEKEKKERARERGERKR